MEIKPLAPRVVIESPFAGDIEANLEYGRRCVADSIRRGEAPFASHLFYTQPGILRDEDPIERGQGILAGFAWAECAEATIVYMDRGVTPGMAEGIQNANESGRPVICRWLDGQDS